MTKRQARRIVDGILDFVEVVGRFEGRRPKRVLVLSDIMDKRTGKVTHSVDRMVAWVKKQA